MLYTTLAVLGLTLLTMLWHLRSRRSQAAMSQCPTARACPRCGAAIPAGAGACPACHVPLQAYELVLAPVASAEQEHTGALHAMVRADVCVGCGACVSACPEPGAIHLQGKLAVVERDLCKGHGDCVTACPVNGILLTSGAAVQRVQTPDLDVNFQSNVPGLYIVGELGGRGLIKNAINEGRIAAEHVASELGPGRDGRAAATDGDAVSNGRGPARLRAGADAAGGTNGAGHRAGVAHTSGNNGHHLGAASAAAAAHTESGGLHAVLDEALNTLWKRPADQEAAAANDDDLYDLIIVGSGPAGLSAGLEALRSGLRYLVLEQGDLSDTIHRYPRHKLLLAEPVNMPLYGGLWVTDASKEALLKVWRGIIDRTGLRIHTGHRVERIVRQGDRFELTAGGENYRARRVVLAMGRRGTPRRLDVPGEELTKVFYDIVEMEAFAGTRTLVVGGGDSAIESAVGLANQRDTEVTLAYRGEAFGRIKDRNRAKLEAEQGRGRITVLLKSQVREIRPDVVVLDVDGQPRTQPNDHVIIRIGGDPPFEFLRQLGVKIVWKELALNAGPDGQRNWEKTGEVTAPEPAPANGSASHSRRAAAIAGGGPAGLAEVREASHV